MHPIEADDRPRRARLPRFVSFSLALSILAAMFVGVGHSQIGPAITATPLLCVATTEFSIVEAAITPSDQVRSGRMYFRSDAYPDFYYVDLIRIGDRFQAVLPKPTWQTQRVIFYYEAVDVSFNITTTPENEALVVEDGDSCRRRDPKAAFYPGENPSIIVGTTSATAPALPPGFAIEGIAQVISVGGAAGGIGAGTLTLAAVGAAAAAGVGVGVLGPDETTTSEPASSTVPPTGGGGSGPPTTTTVNVVVNLPPKACFGTIPSPPVIEVGKQITLDGRCSTPQGDLSYEWDLGDGRRRSGSFVEPAYGAPGNYRVTLTVRKLSTPDQRDSVSDTIRVQSPPEPTTTSTTSTSSTTSTTSTSTTSTTVRPLQADLELQFDLASGCPCKEFNYTLTVTNHGPDDATDVRVLDTLPEELCDKCAGFVGSSPCTVVSGCRRPSIECRLGNLPRGRSIDVNLRLTVPELDPGTTLLNSARVSANETDPKPGNNSHAEKIRVDSCSIVSQPGAALTSSLEIGPADGNVAANVLVNHSQVQTMNNANPFRIRIQGRSGRNRVEAYLVSSDGGEGVWRFDFSSGESFVPGSIEVARGDVVALEARRVVFRMTAKPGERIEFTFLLEP